MRKDKELKSRCVRWARQECANWIDGRCFDPELASIHGQTDEPTCFAVSEKYSIADGGISCDWFLKNVLPRNGELYPLVMAEIDKPSPCLYAAVEPPRATPQGKECVMCGNLFMPASNHQRYCKGCAKDVERKRNAASHRGRYWNR